MSSTPPPVQDQGSSCPNCNAFRPGGQIYCANCGFGRPAQASSSSNIAQIVWIVLFILIGLPSGCLGGCFLILTMGSPRTGTDFSILLFSFGALVVFIGLLAMVIRSSIKKK
jgi:hypothetical protein